MLDDILVFAAETLVDNGRLSFWMPTANDEEQEIPMPAHPCLELVVVCVQVFNKCKGPRPWTSRYTIMPSPTSSSTSIHPQSPPQGYNIPC